MKNKFDKIIEKLFCKHNWKQKYQESIISPDREIRGKVYILICENCGKIKKVSINIFS